MCWTSHPSACTQLMLQVHRGLTEAVEAGNSVLIIEHNPDIVKVADWLIDLGPEGGDRGGELIAEGTPEQIIKVKQSYTGQFLKAHRR